MVRITARPIALSQNVYTVSDDIFYTHGKHNFKFGVLLNRFEDNDIASTNTRGTLVFGGPPALPGRSDPKRHL